LIAPLKLVIVVWWRHWPHHTFDNKRWRKSAGTLSQRWRAGEVKFGSDSTPMCLLLEQISDFNLMMRATT
jgi:hypothetical protein